MAGRLESSGGAGGSGGGGGKRMTSTKKQSHMSGAADDLISTMIYDHERSRPPATRGRGGSPTSSITPITTPTPLPGPRPHPQAATPIPPHRPPNRSASLPISSTPSINNTDPTPSLGAGDNPFTSIISRLWRSKTVDEDIVICPATLTIKQTHWKSLATATRCATKTCNQAFPSASGRRGAGGGGRRNCAMCGLVFCRKCTNYSRRLSASSARPDPLGQYHSICQVCFTLQPVFGGARDHMREFREMRNERLELIGGSERVEQGLPLCSRRSSENKRVALEREVRRLVNGYEQNPGKIRGLMAEVVVPDWQKSSDWVLSKDALACLNCTTRLGLVSRKIHCRVGGQVFCSSCVTDTILLYFDEAGKARWALNGKDGGPTEVPERYCLVAVCNNCSQDLQGMMVEQLAAPPSVFMEGLGRIHSQLSQLQAKVEACLPSYKQLVDSMDAVDSSPAHVEGRHPMRKLIKAYLDLSDAFSGLAMECQKLKLLRPRSQLQEKLLKNIKVGMYHSYSDNMSSFRNLKNHLAELVPMRTLDQIQATLSKQSMERIHVVVQQLTLEALNLQHQYQFHDAFLEPIVAISRQIDMEFKEFLEASAGESWEVHAEVVMKFIQEEMDLGRRRIKINEAMLLGCRRAQVVHYVVVSQCSSLIHECYRELQAKTIDREFRGVKQSLHDACERLDEILVELNTQGDM